MNNTKVVGKTRREIWRRPAAAAGERCGVRSSTGSYNFTNAITQGPNPNAATATAGNSIASLLLGVGTGTYTIGSKNAATQSKYYGAYIQDDWKALPHLTLNLGLRYDLDVPRTERHDRMETFNPSAPSPLAGPSGISGLTGGVVFSGANGNSRRQYSPQWANFGRVSDSPMN